MKQIILFFTIFLTFQSCELYTSPRVSHPRDESLGYLHTRALNTVFRTVKMTDFFEQYQQIREDREASIELMQKYFNSDYDENELKYESFGRKGMRIYLNAQPGVYIVTLNEGIVYYITSSGDRRYEIIAVTPPETKFTPGTFMYDTEYIVKCRCTAGIDSNDNVFIENIDMEYVEIMDEPIVTARITSTSASVKMDLDKAHENKSIPHSGMLKYEISSDRFSDSFHVEYGSRKYRIL